MLTRATIIAKSIFLLLTQCTFPTTSGFLTAHQNKHASNLSVPPATPFHQTTKPRISHITHLHLSAAESSSLSDDDDFMTSLRTRITEVTDEETKLPLIVLDSMLPRQTLEIRVQNALLTKLVRTQLERERPFVGVMGMARLSTGQTVHLRHGIEAEIVIKPEFLTTGGSGGGSGAGAGVSLMLKAGRRFVIEGEVDNTDEGWSEGRVAFLESEEEAEKEMKSGSDRMAVARAMAKARQFTSPNAAVEGNVSLVDRWVQLARENERRDGQIDELLEQLGDCPLPEEPSELAFWVGALINPIPAMGVAMEIRPSLLCAKSADERVSIALEGIQRSIKHMDGTQRMW